MNRNTVIYDRVLLYKNKFEEHFETEYFETPVDFRRMKQLANVPLEEIAKRLDFMMTEHEWFAGEVQRCTVNAFVNNFNSFVSVSRVKIDEAKKAREMQRIMEEKYYRCDRCGQNVKRAERTNHERYTCPSLINK